MAEFNLIDEEWIPCITLDGSTKEFGIRDTLLKAHELREICDDSPLVTVAIHRLLLAILYRAFQGPSGMSQWKALYASGSFNGNKAITDYLAKDRWYDRFFLYDDDYPFLQVAKLDLNEYKKDGSIKMTKGANDALDGLMRLAREAPDKGGRLLFDHRTGTEKPEYENAVIARMLLACQSYAGTGIPSAGRIGSDPINPYKPFQNNPNKKVACDFAPCVKGLCLWLQGENLFQTLMFNLVHIPIDTYDLPAWEDSNIVESAKNSWKRPITFAGPVQRFAPLSRFIRVLDRRSMFFTNGLKTIADVEDPMKAYSRSSDKDQFTPVELRKDKAAWRDAHSLFSLASTTRKPPASLNHVARLFLDGTIPRTTQPRANVVGLATAQGKSLLWRHERIPVPVGILGSVDLTERLADLIYEAEAVDRELSQGLFWSATTKKTIRAEPVGRIQMIADFVLAPSLELRGNGIVRTADERFPDDAHNASCLSLSDNLDPRPAYWARLEKHFFDLLENLPKDWAVNAANWKSDEASRVWRNEVKQEAKRALEESIRCLGTTARSISAVARVRTDFSDIDLVPQPMKVKTSKRKSKSASKGGKKI